MGRRLSIRRHGGWKLVLAPDCAELTTANLPPRRQRHDQGHRPGVPLARRVLKSGEYATIREIAAAEDQRDLRRPTLLYIHGPMPDWRQNGSSRDQGPVN
jgi:hypothetical protein